MDLGNVIIAFSLSPLPTFTFQGKEYQVENIEKEWRGPAERWFLLKTGDNKCFKLCYNEAQDEWLVTEAVKEQENAKRNT